MKINILKLKQIIKNSNFTMKDISLILNISERNLYNKFKNETVNIKELNKMCEVLNIKKEEIIEER